MDRCPAVLADELQVAPLGGDDLGKPGQCGAGPADVGRPDPVPVPGAGVFVEGQQAVYPPAGVGGVAARAAGLGNVPQRLPG